MSAFVLALLVVAANIDNISAGVALGLKHKRIGARSNLIVAGVGALATLAGLLAAQPAQRFIPDGAIGAAAFGNIVFLCIGVETVLLAALDLLLPPAAQVEFRLSSLGLAVQLLRDPSLADVDHSGRIDGGEAATLAVALGLNNLAVGLGAGLTAAPVLPLTLLTGAASFASLALGSRLGRGLQIGLSEPLARLLSGLLFIALGGINLALH